MLQQLRKVSKRIVDSALGLISKYMGIDLGTANTLVYVKGEGVVLCEPSVVAIEKETNRVVAVGEEAKKMLGRTPGAIVAIRPMKDGVISDFEVTEAMLKYFIRKVQPRRFFSPLIVIAIPSGITEVEKRAVMDSAVHAGARDVILIEEPKAAAIGVGLPVYEASGNMIIDIGGGTTEIAVIALSGIVCDQSIRIAGDELTNDIMNYMKREHNILIGERTAEQIKINVGSALHELDNPPADYAVNGRDLMTGIPKQIKIGYQEVAYALDKSISKVEDAVLKALEMTPPELASDIYKTGLYLTGGGALLRGLDKRLESKTKLNVHIAEDPLRAVVRGTGMALRNTHQYSFLIDRKSV